MGETKFAMAVAEVIILAAKSAAADLTPKEIAFACRRTFEGVEALLEPLLEDLSDDEGAMGSIKDSNDSLYNVYNAYLKLKKRGGLEKEVLDDIKDFLPGLIKARSYISTAVEFLQNPERANDIGRYLDGLTVCKQRIMDTHVQVVSINIIISMRADIKLDGVAKDNT